MTPLQIIDEYKNGCRCDACADAALRALNKAVERLSAQDRAEFDAELRKQMGPVIVRLWETLRVADLNFDGITTTTIVGIKPGDPIPSTF